MQRFNHKERRFLVPVQSQDAKSVLALDGGRAYEIVTQYLDTPERTWSALTFGEEHPKIRFRTYDRKDSFLEKKLHALGHTSKERIPCKQIPDGLQVLGVTVYKRTEYQFEETRVTVDRDLHFTGGTNSELTDFLLVEVKGSLPKELKFLRPYEQKRWSKWKFLTGKFTIEHGITERGVNETEHATDGR